jgi:hemerythrin-like domain-containing protein
MTYKAAELLAELRQDHRNMATLLNLLQQEIDRIGSPDESPDFGLMHDIMRYMTVYPDATHHPKEDLIYAGMQARQPDLAEGLEKVEVDHRDIAELGMRLRDDIEAVVAGTVVAHERVIGDAQKYVHQLREHMAWEETDLFRRADEMGEGLELDTSHLDAADPIFGLQRDESFGSLSQTVDRSTH